MRPLTVALLATIACTSEKDRPVIKPAAATPRVLSLPASSQPAQRLAVLLHGVGSSADDLLPVAKALTLAAPDTEFLVPDGFHPFEGGGSGRQWFSIRGITDENRPARVTEAGTDVSRWLDQQLHARGMSGDRLVVIGFSQGAILAQWLALHRAPAPTVVSLAGRLAVEGDAPAAGHPRVLLVHGTADAVMPVALAEHSAQGLRKRGAEVEVRLLNGLGHGIDRRVLDEVQGFLAEPTVHAP